MNAAVAKREDTEADKELSPSVAVVVLPEAVVADVVEGSAVLEGA